MTDSATARIRKEDDDVGGPIQQIRAAICEIAELYALKYSDSFPQLSMFVEGVWRILSAVGLGTRDDQVNQISTR